MRRLSTSNDPELFVAADTDQQVRLLADPRAEFHRALGLDLDLTGVLGGVRCKRYSLVVDDGTVTQINVEPESAPTGLTCSLASAIKL